MKEKLCIILIALCIVSCKNSPEGTFMNAKNSDCKIKYCIEQALNYYLKINNSISDTSTVYSINFMLGFPESTSKDTIILFSELNSNDSLHFGYKGFTTVNNHKIVIFDELNIGKSFYNTDSLLHIELCNLDYSKEELSYGCAFLINNGKLFLYGIQPSDYIPINIK